MSQMIWLASLAGLMSTAVIFGTDAFFLTISSPALRSAAVRNLLPTPTERGRVRHRVWLSGREACGYLQEAP